MHHPPPPICEPDVHHRETVMFISDTIFLMVRTWRASFFQLLSFRASNLLLSESEHRSPDQELSIANRNPDEIVAIYLCLCSSLSILGGMPNPSWSGQDKFLPLSATHSLFNISCICSLSARIHRFLFTLWEASVNFGPDRYLD